MSRAPDSYDIYDENGAAVYTVEGNSDNACRERQYTVGHYEIYGYGTPLY